MVYNYGVYETMQQINMKSFLFLIYGFLHTLRR
jgi:hypothetical protein